MKQTLYLLILLLTFSVSSCDSSKDEEPTIKKEEEKESEKEEEKEKETPVFSVLANIQKAYYLAHTEDLGSGDLTFINNGTQLEADQAARLASAGGYLYSLNYGTGLLTQLKLNDAGTYDVIKEINAGLSVGTNRPRFKLANETTIMVFNVVVEPITNESNEVVDNKCTLRLASISIPDMKIANLTEFEIPQSENAKKGGTIGYHPMRVESPVIADGKIYFGLMHLDMFDPATPPPFRIPKQTGLETLVFDFPSFANGKLATSSDASGHTSGYRAPSMHVDENKDVYQSNWFMSANSFDLKDGDKTVIKRLKNGVYDETYSFNVSDALGLDTNIGTVGWFYVGNGIGYMPIHLENEGSYHKENSWSLARIDLYNKTAVKLDVPLSMLLSYQNGVVHEGNFYMAISPIGGDAFIYKFDPTSTSSNGFEKGLQLDGSNILIEGLFD